LSDAVDGVGHSSPAPLRRIPTYMQSTTWACGASLLKQAGGGRTIGGSWNDCALVPPSVCDSAVELRVGKGKTQPTLQIAFDMPGMWLDPYHLSLR
jgi:hypothetical protein